MSSIEVVVPNGVGHSRIDNATLLDGVDHSRIDNMWLLNTLDPHFNVVQPYQSHTACPTTGIYVYSFSLPSGVCIGELRLERPLSKKQAAAMIGKIVYHYRYTPVTRDSKRCLSTSV